MHTADLDWFTDPDAAQDPAALERTLDTFRRLEWSAPELRTEAGLRQAFDGLQAFAWAGDRDGIAHTLAQLESLVDDCLAAHPDVLWPLEARVHLDQVLTRLESFDAKTLPALERLERLDALAAQRSPEARDLADATAIATLPAYLGWLAGGGKLESLPAPLQDLALALEPRCETLALEVTQTSEPTPRGLRLTRALAHYLYPTQSIDRRIDLLQKLARWTQPLPQPQPADAAFELGMAFAEAGRWAEALPEFDRAHQGYLAAGDAYEMHAHQAEGWLDQAREMLAANR